MRLTSSEIFYLNALNSASGANARDCVVIGNTIAFLVRKGEIGRAIGKNAESAKALGKKLGLNVEILEYSEDATEFIKKALYNIKIDEVKILERNCKKIALLVADSENKRKLQGSSGRIKRIKALAQRDYKIEEIKIR
ncbi:MAG: NusA-like transcription termination signal-binding factor [Candidatus Diapherotrites archaeon]|nr:NusA-like transcription termination signal-binding factor [Candidatus Diapherotrites archaeon]